MPDPTHPAAFARCTRCRGPVLAAHAFCMTCGMRLGGGAPDRPVHGFSAEAIEAASDVMTKVQRFLDALHRESPRTFEALLSGEVLLRDPDTVEVLPAQPWRDAIATSATTIAWLGGIARRVGLVLEP